MPSFLRHPQPAYWFAGDAGAGRRTYSTSRGKPGRPGAGRPLALTRPRLARLAMRLALLTSLGDRQNRTRRPSNPLKFSRIRKPDPCWLQRQARHYLAYLVRRLAQARVLSVRRIRRARFDYRPRRPLAISRRRRLAWILGRGRRNGQVCRQTRRRLRRRLFRRYLVRLFHHYCRIWRRRPGRPGRRSPLGLRRRGHLRVVWLRQAYQSHSTLGRRVRVQFRRYLRLRRARLMALARKAPKRGKSRIRKRPSAAPAAPAPSRIPPQKTAVAATPSLPKPATNLPKAASVVLPSVDQPPAQGSGASPTAPAPRSRRRRAKQKKQEKKRMRRFQEGPLIPAYRRFVYSNPLVRWRANRARKRTLRQARRLWASRWCRYLRWFSLQIRATLPIRLARQRYFDRRRSDQGRDRLVKLRRRLVRVRRRLTLRFSRRHPLVRRTQRLIGRLGRLQFLRGGDFVRSLVFRSRRTIYLSRRRLTNTLRHWRLLVELGRTLIPRAGRLFAHRHRSYRESFRARNAATVIGLRRQRRFWWRYFWRRVRALRRLDKKFAARPYLQRLKDRLVPLAPTYFRMIFPTPLSDRPGPANWHRIHPSPRFRALRHRLRRLLVRRLRRLPRALGRRSQLQLLRRRLRYNLALRRLLHRRQLGRGQMFRNRTGRRLPVLRLSRSLHNMFYNLLDANGRLFYSSSLYALAPKTEKNKQSPEALGAVAKILADRFQRRGQRFITVQFYSRINPRVMTLVRSLRHHGIVLKRVQDRTRTPHNGLRPKKSRNQRR